MSASSPPLLRAHQLNKQFRVGSKLLHAIKNIDISFYQGETVGLVGESGSGKSTLGKLLLKLEEASSGDLYFQEKKVDSFSKKEMHTFRQSAQMIFQDPYASLNPRITIENIVGEGIDIHRIATGIMRRKYILDTLSQVGFAPSVLKKYPREFSGGERQRIVIARAMAVNPSFVVCDEPLSALDICTQRQVIDLLLKLKKERNLAYLFISHDLHAIHEFADRVVVLYLGNIVEQASKRQLFSLPRHPYTQALLSAVPLPDPQKERTRMRILLEGELPSPFNPPQGCPFHPRCAQAMPVCRKIIPQAKEIETGHFVSCHKFANN